MIRQHYDFTLIECVYSMILHYNYDVRNLAEILYKAGFKVAVINYLKDNKYHENHEYEVINIISNIPLPKMKINKSKFGKLFNEIKLDYKRYKYFKKIFNKINEKIIYKNIYIGSLKPGLIPIFFLNNIEAKKKFVWGLRAHFLKLNNYSLRKIRINYRKLILHKMSKIRKIHFFFLK